MRFIAAISLGAISMALSGCVAAVFIPVAGGALLRDELEGDGGQALAQEATLTSPDEMREGPAPMPALQTTTNGASDDEAAFETYTILPTGTLPEPTMRPESVSQIWGDFASFALSHARAEEAGNSALLADPSALTPTTLPCLEKPKAVLIDMDPQGALFPLDISGTAKPAAASLSDALHLLRAENIAIYWITDHSASAAKDIRDFLAISALDKARNDSLSVMRYPGEKKQTRRHFLGRSHCLIAIAGGQRNDFDELYDFLLNQEAAAELNSMIGDGWFLTPPLVD